MSVKEIFTKFMQNTGFSGTVKFDEEIAPLTTFKIGGKASVLVFPEDSFQLFDVFALIKKYSLPYFILGGGSNVVFRDDFFDGVLISSLNLKGFSCIDCGESVLVSCGAGTKMTDFVSFCEEHNFWGAENFAGLPGTVGGAMFMNARCFDKSISEIFFNGFCYDLEKMEGIEIPYEKSLWDYKKSPFQDKNRFILQGSFRLEKRPDSERENLSKKINEFVNLRKEKGHYDFPSAGSVFKNNRVFGSPSGKIIDECGLKGYRIGNAQIAPFHGNMIINLGGATQKDVKNLVDFVVNTVEDKKGFKLEPEIIFL